MRTPARPGARMRHGARRGVLRLVSRDNTRREWFPISGYVPRMTNPLDVFRDGALAGHVAVVTGGGTGICKGIAAAFARFGCEVCITSRKQDVLDATAAELKAATGRDVLAIAADVRDPDAMVGVVEAAKARFGKVDTLVNGAAGNFLAPAIGLSPNAFRTVIDIDLVGSFHAARAAFPALRDAGDGLIINITATRAAAAACRGSA
ncbi:MAG: SDR family NAD(P)-dependent oxidoreductase, partial [Kofleriaceae bacterium]